MLIQHWDSKKKKNFWLSLSNCKTEFSFPVKYVFFTFLLIYSSWGLVSKLWFSKYQCHGVWCFDSVALQCVLTHFCPWGIFATTRYCQSDENRYVWYDQIRMKCWDLAHTQLWDFGFVFVHVRGQINRQIDYVLWHFNSNVNTHIVWIIYTLFNLFNRTHL